MNTIEYQAAENLVEKNSTLEVEECLSEEGWCPVTSTYPVVRVEKVLSRCSQVVDAFKVVVTKDLDLLGDNSPSVISSEKDLHRPWSWKVGSQYHLSSCEFNPLCLRCTPTRSARCAPAK